MRRREYVAAAGALLTGGIAGCLGLGGGGGGETTEAERAMERFLAAIREYDTERVNDLVADDGEIDRWGRREVRNLSVFEPRLVEFEIVEESETAVTADVTVGIRGSATDGEETIRYEFREVDGEWKLWRAVDEGLQE